MKIIAVIAFRNEEQDLPGFFSHLRPFVDGFVAFDDCSGDNSRSIAAAEPKLLELLHREIPSEDHHFESQNRQALLNSSFERGAQWVLCGDADERFETRFLENLRQVVEARPPQLFSLKLVALWENLGQYRRGHSTKAVLFPANSANPYYRPGSLHQPWYPPVLSKLPKATLDFHLYHLGSLTREQRLARFAKFERIDPLHRHQPQGYRNLLHETPAEIVPVTSERSFVYQ